MGVAREEDRRLTGGVRAADDEDLLVAAILRFGHRRAVIDAGAGEPLHPRRVEFPVRDAAGDEDRVRGDLGAVLQHHVLVRSLDAQTGYLLRCDQLRPEAVRLHDRASGEVPSAQTLGKTEVVLDARAHAGLSARRLAFDEGGAQTLGGPVDRRRQTGRTAAHDDQIVEGQPGTDQEADLGRDLLVGRRDQDLALRQDDDRQFAGVGVDVELGRRLRIRLDVDPQIRNLIAGEEIAQVVRGR
jgi:hypothetical protein